MNIKNFLNWSKKKNLTEEESLALFGKNIKDVISKNFKAKDFGYIFVDSKRIKIYTSNFGKTRCAYSRSHNFNFFTFGNYLKSLGFTEVEENVIPEAFQKKYFDNKIWLFDIGLKRL